MKNTLLKISGLTKSFDQSGPVVNKVSFEVEKNEIFALLGPSGCGKTTTLRLIAGFEKCEAGEVHIDDELVECREKSISPQKREIGFVFQDYALFPHMTALENVAF
ncbi:MAG: ATP-binding cassette domain-containing protein, partial [Balneolaceae bacterium]